MRPSARACAREDDQARRTATASPLVPKTCDHAPLSCSNQPAKSPGWRRTGLSAGAVPEAIFGETRCSAFPESRKGLFYAAKESPARGRAARGRDAQQAEGERPLAVRDIAPGRSLALTFVKAPELRKPPSELRDV